MNRKLDSYFAHAENWRAELQKLRKIVKAFPFEEELKWGSPCYTFQSKNVVMIGALKSHCVLSFLKGALLKDAEGILDKPGENTQAARVIRFGSSDEITELEKAIKSYLQEAIEIEKAGLQVVFKNPADFEIPAELEEVFEDNAAFKKAFEALTPGRQRAYVLHFTSAKQSKTRTGRIAKVIPRIIAGLGLNDCACGLSKKMPQCDGSHKSLQK